MWWLSLFSGHQVYNLLGKNYRKQLSRQRKLFLLIRPQLEILRPLKTYKFELQISLFKRASLHDLDISDKSANLFLKCGFLLLNRGCGISCWALIKASI